MNTEGTEDDELENDDVDDTASLEEEESLKDEEEDTDIRRLCDDDNDERDNESVEEESEQENIGETVEEIFLSNDMRYFTSIGDIQNVCEKRCCPCRLIDDLFGNKKTLSYRKIPSMDGSLYMDVISTEVKYIPPFNDIYRSMLKINRFYDDNSYYQKNNTESMTRDYEDLSKELTSIDRSTCFKILTHMLNVKIDERYNTIFMVHHPIDGFNIQDNIHRVNKDFFGELLQTSYSMVPYKRDFHLVPTDEEDDERIDIVIDENFDMMGGVSLEFVEYINYDEKVMLKRLKIDYGIKNIDLVLKNRDDYGMIDRETLDLVGGLDVMDLYLLSLKIEYECVKDIFKRVLTNIETDMYVMLTCNIFKTKQYSQQYFNVLSRDTLVYKCLTSQRKRYTERTLSKNYRVKIPVSLIHLFEERGVTIEMDGLSIHKGRPYVSLLQFFTLYKIMLDNKDGDRMSPLKLRKNSTITMDRLQLPSHIIRYVSINIIGSVELIEEDYIDVIHMGDNMLIPCATFDEQRYKDIIGTVVRLTKDNDNKKLTNDKKYYTLFGKRYTYTPLSETIKYITLISIDVCQTIIRKRLVSDTKNIFIRQIDLKKTNMINKSKTTKKFEKVEKTF
jgi:hypothetical protein